MLANEPVNRFMSEAVLSIDISSPAGEILRLFAGYPVHHLPVVDKTKVVGMLSSADLLKLESVIPRYATSRETYLNSKVNVAAIMRHPPITIRSDQSIGHAATLMAVHGIHGLAVTDRGDNLIGIITTTDIIHAALYPERRGDAPVDGLPGAGPAHVQVTPAELDQAVRAARVAAEGNDSNAAIACALLHTNTRLRALENVLSCADRYLRAGQDERLHAELSKAIERARTVQGESAPTLGL